MIIFFFFLFAISCYRKHCNCLNVSFNKFQRWKQKNKRIRRKKKAQLLFFANTSSHDKTRFYLKRGSDILMSKFPARVRIWVISTVTAPNKHISCKSCSSRTRPSVAATMIAFFLIIKLCLLKFFCNALLYI